MSQKAEVHREIHRSALTVWPYLDNIGGVSNYHVAVKNAPILSKEKRGLRTVRRCEFYDNTSVVETVVGYVDGKSITFELSEFSMPLKSAFATFLVTPKTEKSCVVTISLTFTVKGGILGKLMGAFVIKPKLKKLFEKILIGLDYHIVTGSLIGSSLPPQQTLKLVFN